MKQHKCLKETTHRRTYNLVKMNGYADCSWCGYGWHGCFHGWCYEQSIVLMTYQENLTDIPERNKYRHIYNWKLVSKNRKQWMKKRLLQRKKVWSGGKFIIYYGW